MKLYRTYTVGMVKNAWVGYVSSENAVNLELTIPNGNVKFEMPTREAKRFAERILERINEHEEKQRAERANAED